MPQGPYQTLIGEGRSLVEDRKSKFIGRAVHVDSERAAYDFIESVRKAERGARHNAYAFSLGEDASVMRSSDDGEPPGTAGRKCLEVIKNRGLADCVVVVTRYFGGTLLGTGGLMRAYGKAAVDALEDAKTGVRISYTLMRIRLGYGEWDKMAAFLSKKGIKGVEVDFSDKVEAVFPVVSCDESGVTAEIVDLLSGRAEISTIGKKEVLESGD